MVTTPQTIPPAFSDLGATAKLYAHLAEAMPRVTPHYAVKCFPDPAIMATLAAMGCGFDCASAGELELVKSLGVDVSTRVIFANPCKRFADLAAISTHGVQLTTFDGPEELEKIAKRCPGVGCVLRLRADDPTARMPFGVKYGALESEVRGLLSKALSLGLAVAGVSFHVGSGAGSPDAYRRALSRCRAALDVLDALDPAGAASRPFVVDIGGGLTGGFDAATGAAFVCVGDSGPDAVARAVNGALDDHFPPATFPAVRVISEPGRYFAEASAHIVARVFGKRERLNAALQVAAAAPPAAVTVIDLVPSGSEEEEEEKEERADSALEGGGGAATKEAAKEVAAKGGGEVHYYISDGVYGGFNAIIYDGMVPTAVPFRIAQPTADGEAPGGVGAAPATATVLGQPPRHGALATVFGPTCDSLDMVFSALAGCPDMEVGDYLLFPTCGAYTATGATDFNGIPSTFQGGVRRFYVAAADHAHAAADFHLPKLHGPIAPLSVKKNF